MKKIVYLLFFLLLISCSNSKRVFWCGDHPCINKKERRAYFERTMIVEIKEINKKEANYSEVEKITQQAYLKENERIKLEKRSTKQAKREEKKRLKMEKKLTKQAKLEEKKRLKIKKKLISKKQRTQIDFEISNSNLLNNDFKKLVEKISNTNMLKPYPNVNDIPE